MLAFFGLGWIVAFGILIDSWTLRVKLGNNDIGSLVEPLLWFIGCISFLWPILLPVYIIIRKNRVLKHKASFIASNTLGEVTQANIVDTRTSARRKRIDGRLALLGAIALAIIVWNVDQYLQPLSAANNTPTFAYVVNGGDNNVSEYRMNSNTGELLPLSKPSIATGKNPQCIVINHTGQFAYVVDDGDKSIWQYRINPVTGELSHLKNPTVDNGSKQICAVANPAHNIIYILNGYDIRKLPNTMVGLAKFLSSLPNNTIFTYRINPSTGELSTMSLTRVSAGHHSLFINITARGHYVYVANDNDKTISQFRVEENGTLSPLGDFSKPTNSSPGNIALDPAGQFAYIISSSSNIWEYNINASTGELSKFGTITEPFDAFGAGSIAITPDGHYAYYSNSSIISQYRITRDGALKALKPARLEPNCLGSSLAIDPTGRFLYTVGQCNGGRVSQFIIQNNGTLEPISTRNVPAGRDPDSIVLFRPSRSTARVIETPISSRKLPLTLNFAKPSITIGARIHSESARMPNSTITDRVPNQANTAVLSTQPNNASEIVWSHTQTDSGGMHNYTDTALFDFVNSGIQQQLKQSYSFGADAGSAVFTITIITPTGTSGKRIFAADEPDGSLIISVRGGRLNINGMRMTNCMACGQTETATWAWDPEIGGFALWNPSLLNIDFARYLNAPDVIDQDSSAVNFSKQAGEYNADTDKLTKLYIKLLAGLDHHQALQLKSSEISWIVKKRAVCGRSTKALQFGQSASLACLINKTRNRELQLQSLSCSGRCARPGATLGVSMAHAAPALTTEKAKDSYLVGMRLASGMPPLVRQELDPAIVADALRTMLSGQKPAMSEAEAKTVRAAFMKKLHAMAEAAARARTAASAHGAGSFWRGYVRWCRARPGRCQR